MVWMLDKLLISMISIHLHVSDTGAFLEIMIYVLVCRNLCFLLCICNVLLDICE